MERKGFKDVGEYLSFLKSQFDVLELDGFYNIYLHQIGRLEDDELRSGQEYQSLYNQKIQSFIQNGLRVDKYGSIAGTAKYLGQTDKVDEEEVLQYSFDKRVPHNAVAIFAIPKYIHFDGQTEEFSSFKGRSLDCPILKQQLLVWYKSQGLQLQLRDMKFCLYDAIKGSTIPNIFLLGIQEIDTQSGKISFVSETTHIAFLKGQAKENAKAAVGELAGKLARIMKSGDNVRQVLSDAARKEEQQGMYYDDLDI